MESDVPGGPTLSPFRHLPTLLFPEQGTGSGLTDVLDEATLTLAGPTSPTGAAAAAASARRAHTKKRSGPRLDVLPLGAAGQHGTLMDSPVVLRVCDLEPSSQVYVRARFTDDEDRVCIPDAAAAAEPRM